MCHEDIRDVRFVLPKKAAAIIANATQAVLPIITAGGTFKSLHDRCVTVALLQPRNSSADRSEFISEARSIGALCVSDYDLGKGSIDFDTVFAFKPAGIVTWGKLVIIRGETLRLPELPPSIF